MHNERFPNAALVFPKNKSQVGGVSIYVVSIKGKIEFGCILDFFQVL